MIFWKSQEFDFIQDKKSKSEQLENQSQATIGFISSAIRDMEKTNNAISSEIEDVMTTIQDLESIQLDLERTSRENNVIIKNLKELIGEEYSPIDEPEEY